MKYPRFNSDQVVKIENKEQFDQIYHVLRSAQNGICLEKWLEEISGGYPKFPIYLEHSNSGSVRGEARRDFPLTLCS